MANVDNTGSTLFRHVFDESITQSLVHTNALVGNGVFLRQRGSSGHGQTHTKIVDLS